MDFISSRGCVYTINPGGGGNVNGYRLQGFPTGSAGYPIILTNASVSESDLILPTATLDRKKILYLFGEDYGNVEIMGSVFLGPVGQPAQGLSPVIEYFQSNGVTRNGGKPVNLSMPGNKGYKVYLHGLVVAEANAQLNMHNFVLKGIRAEPPK